MISSRFAVSLFIVAACANTTPSANAAHPAHIEQFLKTKNCEGCDLSETDLHGQNLYGAKLAGANLRDSNLSGANLTEADLSGARLAGANLEGAKLLNAKLNAIRDKEGNSLGVGLKYTRLTGANLTGAEMKGAILLATELRDAKLFTVDLEDASFEPASLPDIASISSADSLKTLTYQQSPTALLQLRKAFKETGFQSQQREITYALMHRRRADTGSIGSALRYVLFELTCEWGLSPLRPLWLMLLFVLPFAVIYAAAIVHAASAGIWRVWDKDRIRQDIGGAAPIRLTSASGNVVGEALYFSFMSAFAVGWHEINVGTWIGRLNPNEYTLRATGWLRSCSGVQSLLSIFLLALAFVCYFGDPFE